MVKYVQLYRRGDEARIQFVGVIRADIAGELLKDLKHPEREDRDYANEDYWTLPIKDSYQERIDETMKRIPKRKLTDVLTREEIRAIERAEKKCRSGPVDI